MFTLSAAALSGKLRNNRFLLSQVLSGHRGFSAVILAALEAADNTLKNREFRFEIRSPLAILPAERDRKRINEER
jgi:hypothetical protein